jgi:hypothetical protein
LGAVLSVPSWGRVALVLAALVLPGVLAAAPAVARPVSLPFDFSRGVIDIEVAVGGVPLHALLDTGVNPSVIDAARAKALGLDLSASEAGDFSGAGTTKQVTASATRIVGLVVAGRAAAPFDALATDLTDLAKAYGRPLDAVLGYSFLQDRIVLIDYSASRVWFLDRRAEAAARTHGCRSRWTVPLRMQSDNFPLIPLRLGQAFAVATLDTGSDSVLILYRSALDLPGVRAAVVADGETSASGFKGSETRAKLKLAAPLGLGPFTLPAGAAVALAQTKDSPDTALANTGNALFAALKLKLLLDYKGHRISFYGDCGP